MKRRNQTRNRQAIRNQAARPAEVGGRSLLQGGYGTGVMMVLILFVLAMGGVAWVYSGIVAHDRWPISWLEVDGSFDVV